MKRFRIKRGWAAALALLPAAAMTIATTTTPAAAESQRGASIDTSRDKVAYAAAVTVRGHFVAPSPQSSATDSTGDGAASEAGRVAIQFKQRGAKRWRTVRRTRTRSDGKFATDYRMKQTGRFRAVRGDGRRTASQAVVVRSKLKADVSRRNATSGQSVRINGTVRPGGRRAVVVAVGGRKLKTHSNGNGRFSVRWKAAGTGSHKVRVTAKPNREAKGSKASPGKVKVFRPASASWYGPGLYGNRTACGQTLTPSTRGVAHKSMPCGTKLTLRYGKRQVKVKVIDRGPYVAGREFDLTEATKNDLGFGSTGTVLSSR